MRWCWLTKVEARSRTVALLARSLSQRMGAMMARNSSWRYDNQNAWTDLPNSQSAGRRQSPIDIITGDAKRCADLQELNLTGWEFPVSGKWSNNGHALQFTPQGTVQGGGASLQTHKGVYSLRQFHFHWGMEGEGGSEHRLDGKQMDAEVHFVMADDKKANQSGDHLTVIGVLLEADDDEHFCDRKAHWDLLRPAPKFKQEREVHGLAYSGFLPYIRAYYYYEGSLTTPPCSEIVQWIIMRDTVKVPFSFLKQLQEVTCDDKGVPEHATFRSLQPLNGRCVWKND